MDSSNRNVLAKVLIPHPFNHFRVLFNLPQDHSQIGWGKTEVLGNFWLRE